MRVRNVLGLVVAIALFSGCTNGKAASSSGAKGNGCIQVNVATSPEKGDLLTALARSFNGGTDAKSGGTCVFVNIKSKASGGAATALANGWDESAEGPRPVVWSPASSSWGAILNQRLADKGQPAMAPADAKPIQLTPLVIAMPKPMAEALGYPQTPIGYADLLKLAQDPQGWASHGHPEWGPFKLGKTNPNFSTSALSATIAQYYAATAKLRDLSLEDIEKPDVAAFAKAVESTVVHYGDTTLTFLNSWYRNDARGTALTYVSAVAVEEKSVIDYNKGNPDGVLDPGEVPKPPKIPLVAVYPKEGTLFSDSPFYVLDAPWVTPQQKQAAHVFEQYVLRPDNQKQVLRFGFRPGNPQVAVGDPIVPANGVDPNQPQTTLGVPAPPVLVKLIDKWGEVRKRARVLVVIDVSGSMGDDAGGGQTKLELASQAAINALDQFQPDDLVGLRVFSTAIGPPDHPEYLDLVPIGPIGAQREALANKIRDLTPQNGTPLYSVADKSYAEMRAGNDPTRINAVLLLTDGKNDDKNNDLNGLLTDLRAGTEGNAANVRLFTIGYGRDADLGTLKRMAEATNAAVYDASDPTTIDRVFTNVVSNF
jgi:Ca-activated chloride channel homolog